MKKLLTILAVCFSLTAFAADTCVPKRTPTGKIARSTTQVNKFKKTHACPATGKIQTTCPGYIVDHIVPLCACGKDDPSNMQWQSYKDSKAKDRLELAQCAAIK